MNTWIAIALIVVWAIAFTVMVFHVCSARRVDEFKEAK